jgi:plastocyanin
MRMKYSWILALGCLAVLQAACQNKSATSPVNSGNGGNGGTTTVTQGSGLTFSPASVTITHGQSVIFNVPGHTVYMGNGSGGFSQNYTSFPVTVTFATAGSYYYYCNIATHSSCSGSNDPPSSTCTGMVGLVTAN